mgnify:CR=1 FL=1
MQTKYGKFLAIACTAMGLTGFQAVFAIADQTERVTTEAIKAAEGFGAPVTPLPLATLKTGIQPIKGSESIPFSNRTNSQLEGCSTLGVIELHHTGKLEDAMIVLRNETYRRNGNFLMKIKASTDPSNIPEAKEIRIEAQMIRCHIKRAHGY